MQRYVITTLLASMAVLLMSAITVERCTVGQLAAHVQSHDITELTVKGQIDARDLRFVADSLRRLQRLDLSQAQIMAYSGQKLFGTVSDYPANELPQLALASMPLTQLSLPQGLTSLGVGSLSGCLSLTELHLPAQLSRIGDYALSGCSALAQVKVSPALTYIGDGAFSQCTSLTAVEMVQPTGATGVGVVPLSIGQRAFAHCPQLQTLQLGSTWSHLGAEAIVETGLQHMDLSQQSLLDSLADWSLSHNGALQQLQLPAVLSTMGDGVLLRNTWLESLILPATVCYLGAFAMAHTTGLQMLDCRATSVPQLGEQVWADIDQSQVKLLVNASSKAAYQSAEQWREFLIMSALRGDVTGDGEVDIADVNAIINIMVGRATQADYPGNADINESGVIDIADVNAIINIMLARALALRRAEMERLARQSDNAAPVQAEADSEAAEEQ